MTTSLREEARKQLKRDFKSKAYVDFTKNGERVAYGWRVDDFMKLVDTYAQQEADRQKLEMLDRLIEMSAVMNNDVQPIYGVSTEALLAERNKLQGGSDE